ncbi:MAG: hypothetical protein B5M52_01375 [Helicobacteraceae bacterium 4484_230]|nr:MAG: hypothetical protein B5M52_01375 [Helicobacteraceae bacterium 4484_230]
MTKFVSALRENDFLLVKKLIKDGADVNDCNENSVPVLALALYHKCDMDIVELLIENGADVYGTDEEGISIFEYAIMCNYPLLVEMLLEKGIDLNKTERQSGFTPLMGAVCYGRGEMVEIFLKHGADRNQCDVKGLSAIDFARKMKKKTMQQLLEQ